MKTRKQILLIAHTGGNSTDVSWEIPSLTLLMSAEPPRNAVKYTKVPDRRLLGNRNFTGAVRGAPRLNGEENPLCSRSEADRVHEDDLLMTAVGAHQYADTVAPTHNKQRRLPLNRRLFTIQFVKKIP